jgi:hypothetical protein
MARKQIKHVVEKANTGRDRCTAGPIEIDFDLNLGFLGLALYGALAHGEYPLPARLLSGVYRIRHSRCEWFANAQRHT